MRFLAIFFALCWSVMAGEYAVLSSGARLRVERHEYAGSKVRLYSTTGWTEMEAVLVQGFEQEDYVPPAPAAAAPVAATDRPAPDPRKLVDAAAREHGLPPEFVRSVVAAESGFRPDAVSRKGAKGLMQLMPATAKAYGADPDVPEQNVDAGTQYLRDLLQKYNNGMYQALAAYNAGPGAVDKYKGVPPYPETQNYINRVVRGLPKQ